jgi:hypothetical protein
MSEPLMMLIVRKRGGQRETRERGEKGREIGWGRESESKRASERA